MVHKYNLHLIQIFAELHIKLKVYSAKLGKSAEELLTDYIVGLPD